MVIGSFKVSYTNKNIWSNLFKDMHFFSKFPYLEYQTVEFNPKKWKPLLKNKNEPIIINISKSNQCWNIPAPCVPKNNISPKFFVK